MWYTCTIPWSVVLLTVIGTSWGVDRQKHNFWTTHIMYMTEENRYTRNCMTKVKQIYIFVWPSRSRYTYLYESGTAGIHTVWLIEELVYLTKWLSKRRYTYLYDLRKSDVHTCMTQEKYVHMLVWIRNSKEEQGIHTCLTEEKQIYILGLVGLRKSKYLYLHDCGKAGIHTCITEKKQIHLQVWLRKSRHTYL